MNTIDSNFVKTNLKLPAPDSHKGQNGKLTIIGGSRLFHGASLFALKIASRIVDMVYYASIYHNQKLTDYLQKNLYSFILIPQDKEIDYLNQSDCILVGPGMIRGGADYTGTGETGDQVKKEILPLLQAYPAKKWLIDAGAIYAIDSNILHPLKNTIITPHIKEFYQLFNISLENKSQPEIISICQDKAQKFNLTIVLKGPIDIIVSSDQVLLNTTGNQGMTKGGTGDCLAGLIAALACTHDNFTAAAIGTYINGLAGDKLYKQLGPYFNTDDLTNLIPHVLWQSTSI